MADEYGPAHEAITDIMLIAGGRWLVDNDPPYDDRADSRLDAMAKAMTAPEHRDALVAWLVEAIGVQRLVKALVEQGALLHGVTVPKPVAEDLGLPELAYADLFAIGGTDG